MFTYHGITISADEILKYSRKSRTDDPLLTVEEVLEKHEKILNEWCMRNLGELVPAANSFQEIGSGETIEARPDFQKILRLIESKKYKAILAVEVQRLSRGDLEDAGRIIKLLRYTNTFVITPDMVFDLNDEYDRDRFKRELDRGNDYLEYYKKISWRGRLESVKAGYYIGSHAPYGYDRDTIIEGRKKRPTLKINEREAEVVRLVYDLYVNQDMGRVNIAKYLNDMGYKSRQGKLFSQNTVKSILENDHYIGKIRWNMRQAVKVVKDGEIIKTRPISDNAYITEGRHPAIISEELFKRAQAKRGRNTRVKASTKVRNPLAGLVYCQCGRAMSYRTYKRDGVDKSAPRLLCDNQSYCHTPSVLYEDILNKVIAALKGSVAEFDILIQNDSENTQINHNNHIAKLEARLEELNRKELSQWEKYSEEAMPKAIFEKLNAKVLEEKETVQKALETAKENAPTVEDYKDRKMTFTEALDALANPNASAQTQNRLLKRCIKRITYKAEGRGNRYHPTEYELDITLIPFS